MVGVGVAPRAGAAIPVCGLALQGTKAAIPAALGRWGWERLVFWGGALPFAIVWLDVRWGREEAGDLPLQPSGNKTGGRDGV